MTAILAAIDAELGLIDAEIQLLEAQKSAPERTLGGVVGPIT